MTAHLGGPRDGEGLMGGHEVECSCPRCPPVVLDGPDNVHRVCGKLIDLHRLTNQSRPTEEWEALCRLPVDRSPA